MATRIHPTAIVSPGAELGDGVEVGPFSVIEDKVVIGEETSYWMRTPTYGVNPLDDAQTGSGRPACRPHH